MADDAPTLVGARVTLAPSKRDSVRFSLIDDEWPRVRAALEQRLRTDATAD